MKFAESNSPESRGPVIPSSGEDKLSVVGIEILLGGAQDLGAFERAVFYGQSLAASFSQQRIHLTPSELGWLQLDSASTAQLSTENTLLLKTIARTLSSLDGFPPRRGGLFFICASELVHETGQRFLPDEFPQLPINKDQAQFLACARKLFSRQVNLSLEGNPLAAGLREARQLFGNGEIDYAVLVGASVCISEITQIATKTGIRLNTAPFTLGFDRSVEGWTFGEGAAAVVLMKGETARAERLPIYASIEGLGHASKDVANPKKHFIPTFVSSETIYQGCLQAFSVSGIHPEEIGCLETLASGFTPLDTAEIGGLARAYDHPSADFTCALGGMQLQSGFLPSISGIVGLVRACLSLHNHFIPAVPTWNGPKKAELFTNTPFYVATDPRTWFLSSSNPIRCAAVNSIGWDGSSAHIILSEEPFCKRRTNQFLAKPGVALFPVAGNSLEELISNLNVLKNSLDESPLFLAALSCYKNFQSYREATFTACLVAQNLVELDKEIASALRDIPTSFEKKKPWQTLAGSFFTPEPAGPEAGIAFVYPGAFNSYIGLGRDLFTFFPQLYERAANLTSDIASTIQDRQLYPRSLEALSKDQLQAVEAQLNADPIAMITSGSLISVLYTMILRDIFKIQPSIAFGYSLGEIGMLFACGIWDQADAVRAKLHASPLFPERLSGPQAAIREHWHLPPGSEKGPIWANYFLMSPVEPVRKSLHHHSHVYLTHINTPRQVVIGGDPGECQQVIAELKCTSLRAPFDFALHCEAMSSEYSRLVDLLTWPVATQPQIRLVTAAGFETLAMDSKQIAEKISSMLCSSLDFPGLVKKTYAEGARIFIELGANANCTRWVEDILKGEPFNAVAVNRRGVDDLTSIVRMLARLVSNGVSLDLNPLYLPE